MERTMGHGQLVWRHVILSTRNSWQHGDQRGFRSRGHRIHSSGDYRNPPPPREHAGLRNYRRAQSGETVAIPRALRLRIGAALVSKFESLGAPVLVCSVSATHAHLLVPLPHNLTEAKRLIGQAKGFASHAVRDVLPGSIWAEGGGWDIITDPQHHKNVYVYIRDKQDPGAWNTSRPYQSPTKPPASAAAPIARYS